ncbi:MAG: hypothetical protein KatS3mg031_2879 [Chitinophagales bacterium]|nr:MAG: hypothetical protein KatS3mg031_2879 [Chitinophagales bacterium]
MKKTILLDAGHGGIDPATGQYTTSLKIGKRYFYDDGLVVYEGVINREYANALKEKLEALGFFVKKVYSEIYDTPLPSRVEIANAYYRLRKHEERITFLSLHSNAHGTTMRGPGTPARGFEVYTSRGNTDADKLATLIIEEYKKAFPDIPARVDYTDGDPDKETDFFVLKRALMPAVLIENLFFTNMEDAELLMSEHYKSKFTDALCDAITKYYDEYA